MKKILIVDDDNILRRLLKHYLEKQGYQVVDAASGKDGLTIFNQNQPDLVVSDVSMPEMDGLEFCRTLRSQVEGQLVPFIFLSAKDDLEDKIKGHSMGADDYLTKPFDMKELLAKIEALLERSDRIHAEILRLMQQLPKSRVDNGFYEQSGKEQLTNFSQRKNQEQATKVQPLPLTPAEEKVFWEVIQGFSNKEIGEHLFISHRTVQTHLSSILGKLHLENRAQLVKFAYEEGYDKVKHDE